MQTSTAYARSSIPPEISYGASSSQRQLRPQSFVREKSVLLRRSKVGGQPALRQTALRFLKVHAWSSKIFYTLFHPATINRLQPQALQLLLNGIDNLYTQSPVPTALTWDTVGPILTVEVRIDLQLPCWPTSLAIERSLNDLTSVLKIYAGECVILE